MKIIRELSFSVLAILTSRVPAQAASPKLNWTVYVNGSIGSLCFDPVLTLPGQAPTNVVTGSMVFATPTGTQTLLLKGFWNDAASELMFYLAPSGFEITKVPADQLQIFTGYMHSCDVTAPTAQCIEGTFQAFGAAGGSASKHVLGWHAF